MKRVFLLVTGLAFGLTAGLQAAHAQLSENKVYVQGNLGLAAGGFLEASDEVDDTTFFTGVNTDLGYSFGGAIGYGATDVGGLKSTVRPEIEVNYRMAEVSSISPGLSDTDLSALSLLFNVWYDFCINGNIIPYVGGGLGIGHTAIEDDSEDEEEFGLAFQFGAGVNMELEENGPFVGVGYRYINNRIDLEGADGAAFGSHVIQASFGVPLN